MGQRITVNDLIDDVRSLLDEDNRESVTDNDDILPALNRAQNYASNILARHYESPMLKQITVDMVAGQSEYPIPEDAFEQRLEKLEVNVNQLFYPVNRIDYRDISLYEIESSTSVPYYYVIVGTNYRLLPSSNGTYDLRLWYLVDPKELVTSQGRINIVNTTDQYIIVDDIGDDLTTESDNLDSYVNFIDGSTGIVKGSMQIKNISGNKITFKTSPTRSSVLNTDIDTDLGNLASGETVEADDFVCVIKGACVPFFKKPFSNFLIQYAVAEIRRKLGGPADMELRVLEGLEKQVERSWVGREQSLRVTKKNDNWDLPVRRYYGRRN